MKKLLTVILSLSFGLCFSQTKKQLINSIIKVNRLESDCIGFSCQESDQYKNFKKLKHKLSKKELVELSHHKNAALRTYVILELVQSGKGNVPELLSSELIRNEEVQTFSGCIMDQSPVSSKVYHEYWNSVHADTRVHDLTMQKLDSVIIYSDQEVYWLLYSRTFNNGQHREHHLPRIKELAFSKHNAYAFEYLQKYYPFEYSKQSEKYFTTDFNNAEFRTENEIFHLHSFIKSLLESENEKYRQIAIAKVQNQRKWEHHKSWFDNLLKKHGVTL